MLPLRCNQSAHSSSQLVTKDEDERAQQGRAEISVGWGKPDPRPSYGKRGLHSQMLAREKAVKLIQTN